MYSACFILSLSGVFPYTLQDGHNRLLEVGKFSSMFLDFLSFLLLLPGILLSFCTVAYFLLSPYFYFTLNSTPVISSLTSVPEGKSSWSFSGNGELTLTWSTIYTFLFFDG